MKAAPENHMEKEPSYRSILEGGLVTMRKSLKEKTFFFFKKKINNNNNNNKS